MREIQNEIAKKYVQERYNEIVNHNLPISSLRNIENYLNSNELEVIRENLLERFKLAQRDLLVELEKRLTENHETITKLNSQIKDYEEDLDTLEKLKTFKRKSKFLR